MSVLKPEDIIEYGKGKYPAIGLTDYTTISGSVEFYKLCKKAGIKPILGCELIISDNIDLCVGTLTLLCKNKQGWKTLLNIISRSNDEDNFKKYPKIKWEDLIKFDLSNFVCIDGYEGSLLHSEIFEDFRSSYFMEDYDELAETCLSRNWKEKGITHISKMVGVFNGDYYLECTIPECCSDTNPLPLLLSSCIEDLSKIEGVKTLIDNPVYYLDNVGAADQRILLSSKLKCTISSLDKKIKSGGLLDNRLNIFLKSSFFKFNDLPKSNHKEIFSKIEEFDILSQPKLPRFTCPDGLSEIEYLKNLCREGWKRVLIPSGVLNSDEQKEIYKQRVLHELDVIERANLAGYFLIVQDYVNEFRNRGYLVGPSRGCFLPDTRVKMSDSTYCPIGSINIGDLIIDANGDKQKVYNKLEYNIDEEIIELELENNKIIRCTKDHKFLTTNRGWVEAQNLETSDILKEV